MAVEAFMWSSKLFWKLFLVYVVLNVVLAVAFLFTVSNWQRQQLSERVEQRLHDTAVVLRSHVEKPLETATSEGASEAERSAAGNRLQSLLRDLATETQTRMTLVAADGRVVADSERDPAEMDNHSQRPELVAAADKGIGVAVRRSPTLGVPMHYLALAVEHPGRPPSLVRVAVDVQSIDQRIGEIHRFLWMLALGVGLLAMALTYLAMVRIIRPLNELTAAAQSIAAGGKRRPVNIRSQDEIGALASSIGDMQDHLDRRMRQLQESSDRMATVLRSMDEGVLAVDQNECVLLANDASLRLLEFSGGDAVGRPFVEITRSRGLHETVAETLRNGGPVQSEHETNGATRRMLSVRATCLPGDPPPGAVVVLHDVSELRRLENLRRELVANVSHELKTPLASIKAYAETLRLGAVDDPENNRAFIGRIEEQAERLHQLILDLLQIARVESGQESFDVTDVSLAEAVDNCLSRYASVADGKGITLSRNPSPQPLHVRADAEGLLTILDNLVDNAIKYTPDNGQVTVAWRQQDGMAAIEVRDTGMGIAERDQARIFERFFRVDKARSRELGGTGLGLSIVKHLVQAFGGTIGVESQPGRGSTFRVLLPRG